MRTTVIMSHGLRKLKLGVLRISRVINLNGIYISFGLEKNACRKFWRTPWYLLKASLNYKLEIHGCARIHGCATRYVCGSLTKFFQTTFHDFIKDATASGIYEVGKHISGCFICGVCIHKDVSLTRRLVVLATNNKPRTYTNFRSRKHRSAVLPFEMLPVNMTRLLPINCMHCACLEIMKRSTAIWRGCLTKLVQFRAFKLLIVDQRLQSYQWCISRDFRGRCRTLSQVNLWKSNEFRQFLLYFGAAALHGILPHGIWQFHSLSRLRAPRDFSVTTAPASSSTRGWWFINICQFTVRLQLCLMYKAWTHLTVLVNHLCILETSAAFLFKSFIHVIWVTITSKTCWCSRLSTYEGEGALTAVVQNNATLGRHKVTK